MTRRDSSSTNRLRIAMIGTRGVPAAYGGFETAVEEIGRRLVDRGHEVIVYCRNVGGPKLDEHLGMKLVYRPAIRSKTIETLSHTALSVVHAMGPSKPDAAFVFNAANAPFVPLLHMRGIPTAVHVDGLEWMRGKWGKAGRRYYRAAEMTAVRTADALIADAKGIADYYAAEFGISTKLITYGAPIQSSPSSSRLHELNLSPGGYHLVVARFEPENHVSMIVEGYSLSSARLPLVVVGSAPYAAGYIGSIESMAAADDRVRLLGPVWDQELLDQLYSNAATYLHGHSVGGTNPSLLRAMGAGTTVLAYDVVFNREVLGDDGMYFASAEGVRRTVTEAEHDLHKFARAGGRLRDRAAERYDWADVAKGYEDLAFQLVSGASTRGRADRRRRDSPWSIATTAGGISSWKENSRA